MRALEVKLTEHEQGRVGLIPTGNLEAYDYFLRGTTQLWQFTKGANTQAQRSLEHALALDPDYAAAAAFLGAAYLTEWLFWNPKPQVSERAVEQAQRAVALDDALPEAHGILGILSMR